MEEAGLVRSNNKTDEFYWARVNTCKRVAIKRHVNEHDRVSFRRFDIESTARNAKKKLNRYRLILEMEKRLLLRLGIFHFLGKIHCYFGVKKTGHHPS